jgi:hypothetical protein
MTHYPGYAAPAPQADRPRLGRIGPRLLPRFANDDYELALASLQQLELVKARWGLPGHGLPWEGSPQQAVKLARGLAAAKR